MTDSMVDPASRALVFSFGRGAVHGVRPNSQWTWCGRRLPQPHTGLPTTAAAVTCGQCRRRGEASRGHAELINSGRGGSDD